VVVWVLEGEPGRRKKMRVKQKKQKRIRDARARSQGALQSHPEVSVQFLLKMYVEIRVSDGAAPFPPCFSALAASMTDFHRSDFEECLRIERSIEESVVPV
jgi:hypothetical protein